MRTVQFRKLLACAALAGVSMAVGCGGGGGGTVASPAQLAPVIVSISPQAFAAAGGSVLTIQGSHFTGPGTSGVSVHFGPTDATGNVVSNVYVPATVLSDTQMTVAVPAASGSMPGSTGTLTWHFTGTVSVQVVRTVGSGNLSVNLVSPVSAGSHYTYLP